MDKDKPKRKKFHIHSRIQSFPYAFAGLKDMVTSQHNAWIHAVATLAAIGFGSWLGIGYVKLALIVVTVVTVWVAEAFNTVFEIMSDILSPDFSPEIKRAKDIAAAAVLIASFGAVLIGLLLFGPEIYQRFFRP